MLELPPRSSLTAATEAAQAVAPTVMIGLARQRDDGRVSMLYSYALGLGASVLASDHVPPFLTPASDDIGHVDASALTRDDTHVMEWYLRFAGATRVVSYRVPDVTPATRMWIGFAHGDPLTNEQLMQCEAIAASFTAVLRTPPTAEAIFERTKRLELTAELLPALFEVLDVREVFDRLSNISKDALPHDMLTLGTLDDALTQVTIYAQSGQGSNIGTFPNSYPPAVTRAWEFDILDDRATHPIESDRLPTALGARGALRFPIRLNDRVIGGLGFGSLQPRRYDSVDVAIGRRLADYVTVAMSHHRLAEQARLNEEARTRAANLELLDEMLGALIETANIPSIFNSISAIAQKVLPHDAVTLPVRIGDGNMARLYASSNSGLENGVLMQVPRELLENPEWEGEVVDRVSERTESHHLRVAQRGFQSLLRVPIRLDGQYAGALIFYARTEAAFKQHDVLVARRMADRIALALARDRELAAARRADDASARVSALESRVRALTDELDARTGYRRVVGDSTEWRQVLTQATQVAPTDTTVLLLGESGTGKEVVARFLHRASTRKGGPFIALNCAALPEQLLEAELFGYERGAYTGATQSKPGQLEQAAGGTLFLDEIGEMSPSAQAKFLRVLQEREFQRLGGTRILRTDARIIAATNRDLPRAITQGLFREDLYYRLNVFAIRLPPLRDRRSDIIPLSEAFLAEIGRGLGRPAAGVSREARSALLEYSWPGNVRELRNILERASILCEGGLITTDHLSLTRPVSAAPPPPPKAAAATTFVSGPALPPAAPRPSSASELQTMEREMIEQALQAARFNKSKAAKALGLTRQQLYIRLRKYGLE